MSRPSARECLKLCLGRARHASPSQVLFGDEPWMVLLGVVVVGFVFFPLLRDDWPWLLVVLLLAVLIHIWHWCCHEAQAPGSEPADREAP